MEISDLTKEELDKLEWIFFNTCPREDEWADLLHLGGAGDNNAGDFPLNLEEIERIDITFIREGQQESVGSEARAPGHFGDLEA